MRRNPIVLGAVAVIAAMIITFFVPRHRKLEFVKESEIPFEWNPQESQYLFAKAELPKIESFLKAKGFRCEGSIYVFSAEQGKFDAYLWSKGDYSVFQGINPKAGNQCFVSEE